MDNSSTRPDVASVSAERVSRSHGRGHAALESLHEVSFTVEDGEVVAVIGPSGSGKTTLLHLLAGLDRPDSGAVRLAGVDWQTLRGNARADFRRRTCGFVPQGFSLLPQATASENVELPLLLDGVNAAERAVRVEAALDRVDLAEQAPKLPDQLSGGQQQRVAIARALITAPTIVFADEPTGSLDSVNAKEVVRLLVAASRERGAAVVLVTHDPKVADHADRIMTLRRSRLEPASAGPGKN
ncbi:MAG: ABC transporter ATP-binding protein [Nocardioidaceae bacterium]